jgi:phosphodiesterase/alkaline phosphatase D-like protein
MKSLKNSGIVELVALFLFFAAFYSLSYLSESKLAGSASPDEVLSPYDFLALTQEHAGQGKNDPGDKFGTSLAAGDFNNDGFMDLAVGAPNEVLSSIQAGTVFLFQGSGGGPTAGIFADDLNQEVLHAKNEDGDKFGAAMAAGDFNGDGFDDLAVGAPGEAPGSDPKSGAVFIFSGFAGGLQNGKFVTQENAGGKNENGDEFGYALAVGDFNGDGFDDLAIGASEEKPNDEPRAGAVFIFPGSGNGITTGSFFTEENANGVNEDGDKFGFALVAGDFNGDNCDDLAIGAPEERPGSRSNPNAGAVFIFPGSGAGITTGDYVTQKNAGGANKSGDQFGWALAAGDLNGDSKDDLVVGAPNNALGSNQKSGAVFIFAGGRLGIKSGKHITQNFYKADQGEGDKFGCALAVGDYNGDGADDLAIGASGEAPWKDPKSGAVFINAGLRTSPVLTHGGLLGAVTDSSIKVWARADRPAVLKVQYKLQNQAWPAATTSAGVSLTTAEDFTGVITRTGLTADTPYDYRLLLDDVVQPDSLATFRTLKAQGVPGAFSFVIGGDIDFMENPFSIFDSVLKKEPDFMLLLGDQIYSDHPLVIGDVTKVPGHLPDLKAAYRRKYKENWAEAHMRAFMKRVPTFMILDDHEIVNNWYEGKGYYTDAMKAYDEYQGKHNPVPRAAGEKYYSFRVGEVDFYVMDTRSHRSANNDQDSSDKTMLGNAQKKDLKLWLSASTAKFKFIISSVPWRNLSSGNDDSWDGFRTERNEIFDYIQNKNNKILGVVLVSGDQHYASVHRLRQIEPYSLYEFNATPLGIRNIPSSGETEAEKIYEDASETVYGLFRIDTSVTPVRITFNVYNRKNESMFLLEITENDINPP